MAGSRPKKHHWVPEFILDGFTDQDGMLHVFGKEWSDRGVYAAAPKEVFHQRDLNTFIDRDGTRNWSLEDAYAEFEGQVRPVVAQIIERARLGRKPSLTLGQLELWWNFFYHQHKRPPGVFDHVDAVQEFDNDPDAYASGLIASNPGQLPEARHDELRQLLRNDASRARVRQTALVRARAAGSDEVISVLANRGMSIAVITRSDRKSFVVADRLMVRLGESELSHPDNELWMPISADVAVSPGGPAGSETLYHLAGENVRHINRHLYAQARIVAARSPHLIRSLIEDR